MAPRKRKSMAASESSNGRDGIKLVSDSMMSTFDIFSDNIYAPIEGDEMAEELSIRSKVGAFVYLHFLARFRYMTCMCTLKCRLLMNTHFWMNTRLQRASPRH